MRLREKSIEHKVCNIYLFIFHFKDMKNNFLKMKNIFCVHIESIKNKYCMLNKVLVLKKRPKKFKYKNVSCFLHETYLLKNISKLNAINSS